MISQIDDLAVKGEGGLESCSARKMIEESIERSPYTHHCRVRVGISQRRLARIDVHQQGSDSQIFEILDDLVQNFSLAKNL